MQPLLAQLLPFPLRSTEDTAPHITPSTVNLTSAQGMQLAAPLKGSGSSLAVNQAAR